MLVGIIVASGCDPKPEIRTYKAPREEVEQVLVSAMLWCEDIPERPWWWFFTIRGDGEQVKKVMEDFKKWVATVHNFKDRKNLPEWQLPAGWTQEAPRTQLQRAIIKTGPNQDSPEIVVSDFGGDLLININRWRGQFDLPAATKDNLSDNYQMIPTRTGEEAYLVQVTGTSFQRGAGEPVPAK